MNTSYLTKMLPLVAVVALLTTGCVVRERTVYRPAPAAVVATDEVVVEGPPPAPLVETVTIAPGPGYVWVGGGWVWQGHWVWARGHWAHPPRRGAVWLAPHYEYRHGVHVFIRGRWNW